LEKLPGLVTILSTKGLTPFLFSQDLGLSQVDVSRKLGNPESWKLGPKDAGYAGT
jgi:hypothetical protein